MSASIRTLLSLVIVTCPPKEIPYLEIKSTHQKLDKTMRHSPVTSLQVSSYSFAPD